MINVPMLADGGAAIAALGGIWLAVVIVALVLSVFWVWMLVDCLGSSLPSTEKLIWVLVILFTHIIGALLNYLMVHKGSGRNLAA